MDVHKSSLLDVFDSKMRLEVPLFQRQYVWNEEQQWIPLWEDIERKFAEALEGRRDAPVHFLGAMVLAQKQTPTGHVVIRQVIDGQQRLTTLQIFLSAYRDFCTSHGCAALALECSKFILNTGMMADPQVDKFKVWPTQLDRPQFVDVITAGSREQVNLLHPLRKKPYARKYEPRPRMVESYLFFYSQIERFFLGAEGEPLIAAEVPIETRVDECFQTLRNALMVVVIDLQGDDDPQVIFETLNARGEPLLPADLLRNYIFFRASRASLDIEKVYQEYWSRFDDEFWRTEVKQGRLTRPRSDLFMQHFLASRRGRDIPIKHLYVEYRHWVERTNPFPDVLTELAVLARQGDDFRNIIDPQDGHVVFDISNFLEDFDIRTAYPLLLAVMDAGVSESEWVGISAILESYLLRRAVCELGTQNYNRIFLALARNMKKEGFTAAALQSLLLSQSGESGVWPDDASFREAWMGRMLYTSLSNAKLVHIFKRLNDTFMSSKSEPIKFSRQLTIEHIMPQNWEENWPLQSGAQGLTIGEREGAGEDDPRLHASRHRDIEMQTLGNLTLLTSELNSAQSNLGWEKKRPAMMIHSLLPINQPLSALDVWDETAIRKRGETLFSRALRIWPRETAIGAASLG